MEECVGARVGEWEVGCTLSVASMDWVCWGSLTVRVICCVTEGDVVGMRPNVAVLSALKVIERRSVVVPLAPDLVLAHERLSVPLVRVARREMVLAGDAEGERDEVG